MGHPTREELDAVRDAMCGKQAAGRTWPFLKTCVRQRGHAGRCRGIEGGMTESEALCLSGVR